MGDVESSPIQREEETEVKSSPSLGVVSDCSLGVRKAVTLDLESSDPQRKKGMDEEKSDVKNVVSATGGDHQVKVEPSNTEEGKDELLILGESEEDVFEIGKCTGLATPRTIPFRSASFSQVEITSEGKYIPSRITLKPTALSGSSYANTLPRSYKSSSNQQQQSVQTRALQILQPQEEEDSSKEEQEGKKQGICKEISKISLQTSQDQFTLIEVEITEERAPVQEMNEARINPKSSNAPSLLQSQSSSSEQTMSASASSEGEGEIDKNKVLFEVGDLDYIDPCLEDESQSQVQVQVQVQGPIQDSLVSIQDSSVVQGPIQNPSSTKNPTIIREESLTLGGRSSSEEGPRSDLDSEENPLSPAAKAKIAFKMGLHAKLPLLDLDSCGSGGRGGGSSISGSGGEDDPPLNDKFPLYRQSSGQSDASDEIQTGGLNPSSPPPPPPTLSINSRITPLAAALVLDSTLHHKQSSLGLNYTKQGLPPSSSTPTPFIASSSSSSPPPCPGGTSSYLGSGLIGSRDPTPGSPPGSIPSYSSELGRAHSVCSRSLPPRRYNKRPLRGPYGEMLEAEMNKVINSRRAREYDSMEFFRESKSSSPSRSPPLSDSSNCLLLSSQSPKLSNTLLMASMDDLNLSSKQSKHPANNNPRSRKITTNLPLLSQPYPSTEEGSGLLSYHQRTSSSPSQLLYTSSEQPSNPPNLDASPRGHVLAELVETEKSYVDSLRILVKKYMEPLKTSDFIDTGLVDEIFFQIPAVQWHHERLLDALQRRVTDDNQCVGDVLLDTFRQNSLLECYSLFVNNWKNAKGSLKMAVASKPPLARFLEANARQHKGKLSVDSLLIMPIQRIPRYELLLKELLKHTEPTHEDHSRLVLVLEKIKKFAVHIDCASVDPNDNREIEIEGWSAGLGHLVRQDVVLLTNSSNVRKERCFFLFADSIVIASIKRKSTMRKTSSSASHSSLSANLDGCKFKLLMKVPLTDLHILSEDHDSKGICGGGGGSGGHGSGSGSVGSGSGSGPNFYTSHHDDLEDLKTIHKMMDLASLLKCHHTGLDEALKELASGLKHQCDNSADVVEIEIRAGENNSESGDILKILFGSADKKNVWLDSFQDTLGKFIRYGFGKMPQMQFLQALPIRKTRAGLLLSCAAPVSLHNKITKCVDMSDVWVANSDGYVGQICILTLNPEPSITSCNGVCNSRITCILSVPPQSYAASHPPLGLTASHPHSETFSEPSHPYHHHHHHHSFGYESEDDGHKTRSSHKSSEQWNVWLGTEDGALHVYDCSDSVRVKKNRHKIQHKSPLNCMVYYDSRVLVSLGNGDVAVYNRNPNGKGWLVNDPSWITIGTGMNPVTRMLCVSSSIWCACGSQVKVYGESGGMLELLQSIQLDADRVPKGVASLAATDDAVWIALQGSSTVKCYSNLTYQCLFQTDVAPEVSKILAGCDDIIRQHKSACLRVTALLVAPDKTLWIGTSAGVLLTLNSPTAIAGGPTPTKITLLCHGHTGQVRFLTSCSTRDSCVVISGGDGYEEFRPCPPLLNSSNNNASFSSVVSSLIGDNSVDLSGREDSTNHLLIWKVPKLP